MVNLAKHLPLVSTDARAKISKLFDGMKGFPMAAYDRKVLLKNLTVSSEDV